MRGRRLGATAIDALLLVAPWAALAGLMVIHGAWGGEIGGLGDAFTVAIGCAVGSALLLLLEAVTWLAAGRTVGMGLVGVAVIQGRSWLASIVVVALTLVLGGGAGAAAIAAGSVNPQNAVALVLVAAKLVDLAFMLGGSARTLVDRASGLRVGIRAGSPPRRVAGGLTIDALVTVSIGAPLLLALTDLHDLTGAALGTAVALLGLLGLQVATLAATQGTLGMRVLA